jgi:hypothetical protein
MGSAEGPRVSTRQVGNRLSPFLLLLVLLVLLLLLLVVDLILVPVP